MMRNIRLHLGITVLLCLPGPAGAQTALDSVERALGLPDGRDNGVEVRVWLGGSLRVSTLYRIVKTLNRVSVDRFAWTRVERPAPGEYTEAQARRETKTNRQLLQKERCLGKVTDGAEYMWCKVAVRTDGDWSVLFGDLLPDELWKLPPQGDRHCGSLILVDGEAVRIEMIERGRRHSVEYWNPHVCCPTVACAVADHVRSVVRNIQ